MQLVNNAQTVLCIKVSLTLLQAVAHYLPVSKSRVKAGVLPMLKKLEPHPLVSVTPKIKKTAEAVFF
jgi:hypothetical protein